MIHRNDRPGVDAGGGVGQHPQNLSAYRSGFRQRQVVGGEPVQERSESLDGVGPSVRVSH